MSEYVVVIEPDVVVAADLCETLSERYDTAVVECFSRLDKALAFIAARSAPEAAIVNWPYTELVQSSLDAAVAQRGGKIIVTRGPGEGMQHVPDHWLNVPTPFTTDTILRALA